MINKLINIISACIFTLTAGNAVAQNQTPIRIAYIDPLTGSFSATGYNALRQFEFAVDELVNSKGGVLGGRMLEIVPYDNKGSAQESQLQLRRAISEGFQFILQGNSSAVAGVLTEAINRHNRRNTDQRVLYINYAAVDPALTNQNCNFWHFRFDAHADMKMQALTDMIAQRPEITRVYIIGQDYSFGKSVSESAVTMLKKKRPDIQIVGNELHPMEQVKDFTPYVTKIVSSGADAIITGNWGADMVSLGKAITDAGIKSPIFTYYAAYDGISSTIGQSGLDQFRMVHEGYFNPAPTEEYAQYIRDFKQRYPDNDVSYPRVINTVQMLAKAIDGAGSTDPAAVAMQLENMEITTITGDRIFMRADDHQLFQPIQISVHTNEGITFDADNSGYGLRTEVSVPLENTMVDHSCSMVRP